VISQITSWLLSEHCAVPEVHADGRVTHFDGTHACWCYRVDRLTVLARGQLGALYWLTPGVARELVVALAGHGWFIEQGDSVQLAHPDAVRGRAQRVAELLPGWLEHASQPPRVVEATGRVEFWDWASLTVMRDSTVLPVVALDGVGPDACAALLRELEQRGWKRLPKSGALAHPDAQPGRRTNEKVMPTTLN
jgi:hypothetical protein